MACLTWCETVPELASVSMPIVRALTFLLGIAATPEMWKTPPESGLGLLADGKLDWMCIIIPGFIYVVALMRMLVSFQRQGDRLRLLWPVLWMAFAALLASEAFPLWLWFRLAMSGPLGDVGNKFPLPSIPQRNWVSFSVFMLLACWIVFRARNAVDVGSLRRLIRDCILGIIVIDSLVLLSAGILFQDLRRAGVFLLALLVPAQVSLTCFGRVEAASEHDASSRNERRVDS